MWISLEFSTTYSGAKRQGLHTESKRVRKFSTNTQDLILVRLDINIKEKEE